MKKPSSVINIAQSKSKTLEGNTIPIKKTTDSLIRIEETFGTSGIVKAPENEYTGNEANQKMKKSRTTGTLSLLSCSTNNQRENFETAILEQGKVAILEGIRLTNDDIQCLRPKEWLIDNVIEFSLQHQRNFIYTEHKNEIEIVSPAVVHAIKLQDRNDVNTQMLKPIVVREFLIHG